MQSLRSEARFCPGAARRRGSIRGVLGLILLLVSVASGAQTQRGGDLIERAMTLSPNPSNGAQLYRELCTSCHGAQGQGNPDTGAPVLAGQRETYLVKQLIDMAEGDRLVPEMHRLMSIKRLSTPQAVRNLAAYVHALPAPIPELGDGEQLALGARLYTAVCAQCHGPQAEGNDAEAMPRLHAQHYSYLLAQSRRLPVSHRYSIDITVLQQIELMSFEELAAVADYLSRLPPPPAQRPSG